MRDGVLAEISAEAIRGNLRLIRERAGATTPLCAAVKANAYGHGLDVVLPILAEEGVERVATANLTEALDLRQRGWHRPILCLGAPLAAADEQELREKCELAVAGGIEVTVSSLHETQMLSRVAAQQGTIAHIQIKLDSGMGRMGLLVDQAVGVIVELAKQPFVRIQGIYT
ncbi:MAG: alanine racemase, partial [Phycisphaerae bacterium]|nr:alanine racemase [Phycisphaerae bacterium]